MRTFSKKPNNATVGPRVSGYVSGLTEYVENDVGVDSTALDVDAVIGAAWESVGPTGSGATNIWTALDNVPPGAKWVEIRINSRATDTSGTQAQQSLYARVNGSASAANETSEISDNGISITGATAVQTDKTDTAKIPIDSSNIFELYRATAAGDSFSLNIYLVGWGI